MFFFKQLEKIKELFQKERQYQKDQHQKDTQKNINENIDKNINNASNKTKIGALKYFNRKGGFGFIASKETAKDVFVHCSEMNEKIKKGDKVKFEVYKTTKGLRARNVELAS